MFKLNINENVYINNFFLIIMAATIKEIAKKAKVSIATVSRALNNDEKVKPETRDLIKAIADELDYNPNILARNFVKQKSNIIGLVLPDIFDEFFTEVIKGVEQHCFSEGYYTMVTSSHSKKTTVEAIVDFMSTGLVGGIIMMAPAIGDNIKDLIRKSTVPFVIINGKKDIVNTDSINIDNYSGSFEMTEYLIKKGYKKIAHITGARDNVDAEERLRGYTDALKKYNIKVNKNWIVEGAFTIESGVEGFNVINRLKNRPEVIFAANDMMAIGCYNAARKAGVKIPSEIGIAGFDGIFMSEYLTPRLTTIQVPIYDLGVNAAKILLKRISGERNNKPQHIKIQVKLIEGSSC